MCSLKRRLHDRAPKTVNNVLTVLNVLLKKHRHLRSDRVCLPKTPYLLATLNLPTVTGSRADCCSCW
jgi:hypothetical protein